MVSRKKRQNSGGNRFLPLEAMASTNAGPSTAPPASIHIHAQREFEIIQQHVNHQPTGNHMDWRQMPEIPSAYELNPDWNDPALMDKLRDNVPTNPVDSPYESKDKYLETQYRLHREETIAWLRLAIKMFKENSHMEDTNEACVYTKVFVQGYLMTRLGPVCRVQFSTERAGKLIDWKHSTRLRSGSLVALSTARDKFRTICMPVVIADHYYEGGLDQNPPTIQFFWGNTDDALLDPLEELVMVESRFGYFEATRHAMVGLQHVAKTSTALDKYLVAGCKEDLAAEYVKSRPHKDIGSLIHHLPDGSDMDDDEYNEELCRVRKTHTRRHVLDKIGTEISKYTNLDNSQLSAVHRMVTRECAMVQGPPGTGKTFTSVQALQVLLENQGRGEEVVIVSAQTNHAVDQIMALLLGLDYVVARLGGRTQNEELKKRSMYNIRQTGRSMNHKYWKQFRVLEKERGRLNNQIQNLVTDTFTELPLTPDQLSEARLVTEDQLHSLDDDEWVVEEGDESIDPISQWLGKELLEIMPHGYQDPLFSSFEVVEEDAESKIDQQDIDLDALIAQDDGDEDRLFGTWIPLGQKWTGAITTRVTLDEIKQELEHVSLWDIDENLRGAVYRYWQTELVERRLQDFRALLKQAVGLSKRQKVQRWINDVHLLRAEQVQVIGCTTTGLTKYRGLLSALRPRTILIEEAAETREANISSGLIEGLQQLILVGDHQQLAPNTDVQALAESPYNLKVSMFERLIQLGLPFTMLNMQRRMISPLRRLLNPYYPDLIDHPIVATRNQHINGIAMESFWFHHEWEEATDEDFSKFNDYEAMMVIGFVKYLLMNGVDRTKITILTFYRGQCRRLVSQVRRQLLRWKFPERAIRTVDSYQGEENDFVLLSLVRSKGRYGPHVAGFVENKNRGVVSISRARQGFFIFGNAVNFFNASRKSYDMWGPLIKVLDKQGKFLGDTTLPLVCQNHKRKTEVKHPDDWHEHDGGCSESCRGRFECGHSCDRKCHPMAHSELECRHKCDRVLHCSHTCANKCSEKCACVKSCTVFTGASLRGTDVPAQASTVAHSVRSIQKIGTRNGNDLAAWKIDKYVASLGSQELPTPIANKTTLRETYRHVEIDALGNRVYREDIVSSTVLDESASKDLIMMNEDDFPSLAECGDALIPLLPIASSSTNMTSRCEAGLVSAPEQAGRRTAKGWQDGSLIDLS